MAFRALVLFTAVMAQAWMPTAWSAAKSYIVWAAPATPRSCSGLTLTLRPGVLDATGYLKTVAPTDMPLDPVVAEMPIQPGSSASHLPLPLTPSVPPILLAKPYLKTAVAEYAMPGTLAASENWYAAKFLKCGYTLKSHGGRSQNGGPREDDYTYQSPTTPSLSIRLSFEQPGSGAPLLLVYAYAITLPPRPAASLVQGRVSRMQVTYVFPDAKTAWKVSFANQSNIGEIIEALDTLSPDVGVHTCFGSQQQATIRFFHGTKSMTFALFPGCYDVDFGKQLRLLDTNHAVWNALRAAVYDYCLGHRCTKLKV